jgi:signal transduction histidine kinase/CheY-like chemotaxis protein
MSYFWIRFSPDTKKVSNLNYSLVKRISIEVKIAILIVIAVGLVAVAGNIAYKSISYVVSTIKKEAQPNLSLVLIKEINTSLIQAESSIKYYTLTGKQKYLAPYYTVIRTTDDKIEKLRKYNVSSSDKIVQIDSISLLIHQKFLIWNRMLALKGTNRLENALSELSVRLDSSLDSMRIKIPQSITIVKPDTFQQNTFQDEDKGGFFSRLFKKKEEPPVNHEENYSSQNYIKEEVISKDTVIEIGIDPALVQDEISRIRKEEGEVKQIITAREMNLSRQSDVIAQKIRLMIYHLEQQEMASINEKAIEADKLAKSTNKLLVLFLAAFSILLLGVFYVIQSYTRKSYASHVALIKAKDEALRLTKTREMFMANISHEIRTPMHAISGYTEQLLGKAMDKETKEHVEIIKKSADHLHGIINDVLDFSKLDAGKFEIEKIPFSPRDIITEVYQLYKAKANSPSIRYELIFESNIPDVLIGDPLRLKQILLNLVSNALKFTSSGYVKIMVLSKKINSDYSNLLVRIKDSGIGISEKSLPFVFEEFNQAEASTSRKFGGTGLGLSIVKKLVEVQGGKIDVKSKLKEGTSFLVEIPYYVGKELQKSDVLTVFKPKPGLLSDFNFLIADDDEYNRGLISHIFNKWGLKYTLVEDGRKIIEQVNSGKGFQLILLDIQMPEMNGIEVANYIRGSENKKISSLPMMALTATTAKEEQDKCFRARINHVMAKPFSEQSLFMNICEVLKVEIPKEENAETDKAEEKGNVPLMLKNLYHIANNDEGFVIEMLHMFIKTSREGMIQVNEGLKNKDWEKVAEFAHKIKSPCKHLDASNTADLLKEIEQIARREGEKDDLSEKIKQVENQIAGLIQSVEIYLSSVKA